MKFSPADQVGVIELSRRIAFSGVPNVDQDFARQMQAMGAVISFVRGETNSILPEEIALVRMRSGQREIGTISIPHQDETREKFREFFSAIAGFYEIEPGVFFAEAVIVKVVVT